MWYKALRKINIKDINSREEIVLSYWSEENLKYVISANKMTHFFFLYEWDDNNKCLIKTKYKSNSPLELETKINLKQGGLVEI